MSDPVSTVITTTHLISAIITISMSWAVLAGITIRIILNGIYDKIDTNREYDKETRKIAVQAKDALPKHVEDFHT